MLMFMQFLTAGCAAGLCSGLFGLGGGIVLVPALLLLLAGTVPDSQLMPFALGTSLAAIVFSCGSSAWAHWRRGAVDVVLWRRLAPTLVLGAAAGALVAPFAPSAVLVMLAALEAYLCFRVAQKTFSAAAEAAPRQPSTAALASISALAGSAGVGIGTLTVYWLRRLNVPAHTAVGTAAALGVPAALAAAGGFAVNGIAQKVQVPHALGFIHLVALAGIVPGVVLGAQIGAQLAHRCAPKMLMGLFCAAVGAAAARSVLGLSA